MALIYLRLEDQVGSMSLATLMYGILPSAPPTNNIPERENRKQVKEQLKENA